MEPPAGDVGVLRSDMSAQRRLATAGAGIVKFVTPPLLLYSVAEFRDLIRSCLEVAGVRSLVEIGSEAGESTRQLFDVLSAAGGEIWCVEPEPTLELERLADEEPRFHLVRGRSPEALRGLRGDAWVIDGDHNYWTVSRELEHADRAAREAERPALLVLHDVAWPCARRDQYYAPDALPDDGVHPHSFELGRVPGVADAVRGGFRGRGSFAVALQEGGPRNGVLTAVEDFMEGRDDLRFVLLPVVFGLGVVFSREAAYADELSELLAPFDRNALLEMLERNRVQLYLKVLELQDATSDLGLRQSRLLAEYERSVAAAEAQAAHLRFEVARLKDELREKAASAASER